MAHQRRRLIPRLQPRCMPPAPRLVVCRRRRRPYVPPLLASPLATALYLPLPHLLIIVLEIEIYIYDISNMKLHIIETTPHPEGVNAAIASPRH